MSVGRIARAEGIRLSDVEAFLVCPELRKVGELDHIEALRDFIAVHGLDLWRIRGSHVRGGFR